MLAEAFREPGSMFLWQGSGNKHASANQITCSNTIAQRNSGLDAPPFVGLAHELIHAWHGLNGEKKTSVSEEESRTVGTDEYAGELVSENAFRADATLEKRES